MLSWIIDIAWSLQEPALCVELNLRLEQICIYIINWLFNDLQVACTSIIHSVSELVEAAATKLPTQWLDNDYRKTHSDPRRTQNNPRENSTWTQQDSLSLSPNARSIPFNCYFKLTRAKQKGWWHCEHMHGTTSTSNSSWSRRGNQPIAGVPVVLVVLLLSLNPSSPPPVSIVVLVVLILLPALVVLVLLENLKILNIPS